MLRYKTYRTWFSCLLRHLARKWSRSILTAPEPACGTKERKTSIFSFLTGDNNRWAIAGSCQAAHDSIAGVTWNFGCPTTTRKSSDPTAFRSGTAAVHPMLAALAHYVLANGHYWLQRTALLCERLCSKAGLAVDSRQILPLTS